MTAAASSESEYVALAEMVNELQYLQHVNDFIIPPIEIRIKNHDDNEAVKIANNRFSRRRSRHVDVKHHIIRGEMDEGVVHLEYVQSGKQHAEKNSKLQKKA